MQITSDIIFEFLLGSALAASFLGYLTISPGIVLSCLVAVHCCSRISKSIEMAKTKPDTIEVRVIQESHGMPIRYVEHEAEEQHAERKVNSNLNAEVLTELHSRRMNTSLGSKNLNNQEQESDGSKTMQSLAALQGMRGE